MGVMEQMEGNLRDKMRSDLVGLDFGASGIKAVRMRRAKDKFVVCAVDILPPLDATSAPSRLNLPANLLAKYAAVCVGGGRSVVRLLDIPLNPDQTPEEQIQQQFNLSGDYRMGHFPITPTGTKGFLRTIAVAIDEETARSVLERMSSGLPSPDSLELCGLAALNAYMDHGINEKQEDAVALIEGGTRNIYHFILYRGRPVLIRKFESGAASLSARIQAQFGLDAGMADNMLQVGAIDISNVVREVMGEFLRQLVISKDYVERQDQCRLRHVLLTGGLSSNPFWVRVISETFGLPAEAWNPFSHLDVAPGAYPNRWRGHEGRFAAAVGAACGGLRAS